MKVAVLDLGLGNLLSIKRGLERAGAEVEIIGSGKNVGADVDAYLLPGVGAFRDGISALGKFQAAIDAVKSGEKPLLGICLGMQLFFTKSYEGGEFKGLDLVKGEVVRLPNSLKVPHMGWNSIKILRQSALARDLKDGEYFYFGHSYYCRPAEDVTIAETDYGLGMTAMVEKGNLFGTQFHPEKSGAAGLTVLRNFLEAIRR